jgi:hypothetical protein
VGDSARAAYAPTLHTTRGPSFSEMCVSTDDTVRYRLQLQTRPSRVKAASASHLARRSRSVAHWSHTGTRGISLACGSVH